MRLFWLICGEAEKVAFSGVVKISGRNGRRSRKSGRPQDSRKIAAK